MIGVVLGLKLVVLDASLAVALALGRAPPEELAGARLTAPPCFAAECAKALAAAARKGRTPVAALSQPEIDDARAPLIEDHRLTENDERYLRLAKARGAMLASLDRKLRRAARLEGLAVIPPEDQRR